MGMLKKCKKIINKAEKKLDKIERKVDRKLDKLNSKLDAKIAEKEIERRREEVVNELLGDVYVRLLISEMM